jgi:hypothetical protein
MPYILTSPLTSRWSCGSADLGAGSPRIKRPDWGRKSALVPRQKDWRDRANGARIRKVLGRPERPRLEVDAINATEVLELLKLYTRE